MKKSIFYKFFYLSFSNVKIFILINLLFIIPFILFFYPFFRLIPVLVQYVNSRDVLVEYVNPKYKKLSIVVMSRRNNEDNYLRGEVYIFKRNGFNKIRKYIFLSMIDEAQNKTLKEESLGYREIPLYSMPFNVKDSFGNIIANLKIENVRSGSVEIMFYNATVLPHKRDILIYLVLMMLSLIIISGSLGGVCDFVQRVVFHEIKSLHNLFFMIRRYFFRSLLVSLFIFIVISAITANVYFYIFIISNDISVFIAALNFWMLIFFLFVLLWVYPLLVLSKTESVWKVMKKSLFVSFDNFKFSLDTILHLIPIIILSFITLFLFPGISFIFSFLNTALKEISFRYSKTNIA